MHTWSARHHVTGIAGHGRDERDRLRNRGAAPCRTYRKIEAPGPNAIRTGIGAADSLATGPTETPCRARCLPNATKAERTQPPRSADDLSTAFRQPIHNRIRRNEQPVHRLSTGFLSLSTKRSTTVHRKDGREQSTGSAQTSSTTAPGMKIRKRPNVGQRQKTATGKRNNDPDTKRSAKKTGSTPPRDPATE